MKGKHKVIIQNNRLHYEFEIKRYITIIQGDSATGKTTLINMLRQAENMGRSSGIDVQCDVPCRVLEGANWKLIVENVSGSIFFTDEEICVIADGAAIGPEMSRLFQIAERMENINLYLPESFEWIILSSGLIGGKQIDEILKKPEEYIDGKEFFSWERYFTRLLIQETKDTYLSYTKSRLNKTYLHPRNKEIILKSIRGIIFK